MPKITTDGARIDYLIERLDGGRNTKDSPSEIDPFESPDALNIVYDDLGSVGTRNGTKILNTQAIGSFVVDHGTSYNGSMIVACGGSLYRKSNTTFVTIPSAQSVFVAGQKLSFVQYQGLLFMSDGTSAYKYAEESRFHQMGIAVPTACTASGTSAGVVAAGTYHYKISNVNTQAVEGQLGSVSNGAVLAGSAVVGLVSVPVGAASHGVNTRNIYRSNSGTAGVFKRVGTISDNTTTTFADNTGVGSEGVTGVTDGTAPTAWTTARLHKERIFFDDASDRSLLRYTEYTVPFISEALSFKRINTKSGRVITCIEVQDDFVTSLMDDNETWVMDVVDPSDDTTWVGPELSPSNYGVVGKLAATRIPNGLFFVGKKNGRITGFHILKGLGVQQTSDGKMRTESISEKIEPDLFGIALNDWNDIATFTYNNRVYAAIATSADVNINKHVLWFDINRLGSSGQPGSWALWDAINASSFWEHEGSLFAGSSVANGYVYQLELDGVYSDLSTSAINSYHWTREDGMGEAYENINKDFRFLNIWFAKLGAWFMNVRRRVDGDTGDGDTTQIDLNPGGSLFGIAIFGIDLFGGSNMNGEIKIPIGTIRGKRLQTRFDNQNIVNQAFKVHRYAISANLRSRR